MSHFVDWIAAEGANPNPLANPLANRMEQPLAEAAGKPRRQPSSPSWKALPAHNFPARAIAPANQAVARSQNEADRDPDLWLYRRKTVSLLRRYMRWSLEAGRLPSLLGRELFRSRITSYSSVTFESRVIFLFDVERCLDRLDDFDRQIVARVILQEHSHEAAARLLRCTRRTLERRVPVVLDELSDAFLKAELLTPFPQTDGGVQ
jgi:hypothetical protein